MRGICRWILPGIPMAAFTFALLAAGAALAQGGPESAPVKPPQFKNIQKLESKKGELLFNLKLGFNNATIGEDRTRLRTYNGSLVGPTLVARPGDTLRVLLENGLPCPKGQVCTCKPDPCAGGKEAPAAHMHSSVLGGPPPATIFNTTNLHTHGLHVSPKCNSDNVFVDVEPQCRFSFEFKIPESHPAGTFWYHPHVHGSTAIQVSSGAEGALIIRGKFDEVPGLRGAGEDILLFQQIPYKCNFADAADWKCTKDQIGLVEDFGQQFGPKKWQASGRFTTVNGLVQPVIKMRPEEVRRWRLIHGGVRERLVVAVGQKAGDGFSPLSGWLNLIALDGLPTGDVKAVGSVKLDPGYRADVLARAPKTPGTYYLLDEPSAPLLTAPDVDEKQVAGAVPEPEPRKVLAVIVVEGNPCSDRSNPCHASLPQAADLKPFRLPSVTDAEIAGRQPQKVYFDISGGKFKVCDQEFDPKMEPRKLEFGKADEWIVASSNVAGHPFHIHVNPFEVIEPSGERYWKDTLFVDAGTTVKLRTRYETFDGDFVLHCHILDHEDQGMMETVRIAHGPQPVQACTIP
jgi:FtsP/CotA-like multicopper oxidase with cupredoxin domain